MTICKYCWSDCDTENLDESEFINLDAEIETNEVSSCCLAPVIEMDAIEIEEISLEVEEHCFTLEEAVGKYGDIAYYINEHLVAIPDYGDKY